MNEYETNTSACYTGIISVKIIAVDRVKTKDDTSMYNPVFLLVRSMSMRQIQVRVIQELFRLT